MDKRLTTRIAQSIALPKWLAFVVLGVLSALLPTADAGRFTFSAGALSGDNTHEVVLPATRTLTLQSDSRDSSDARSSGDLRTPLLRANATLLPAVFIVLAFVTCVALPPQARYRHSDSQPRAPPGAIARF